MRVVFHFCAVLPSAIMNPVTMDANALTAWAAGLGEADLRRILLALEVEVRVCERMMSGQSAEASTTWHLRKRPCPDALSHARIRDARDCAIGRSF